MQVELENVFKLIISIVLALPVAWQREKNARSVGLRTFPLVAAGACAYVLIGLEMLEPGGSPDAKARILQGLLSGIGFLGGGAILKNDDKVRGTASAAAIWITGGIGCAVAAEEWTIAVSLSALEVLVFVILGKVKDEVGRGEDDRD